MADQKIDALAYGFPKGLSQPALRALLGAGITSLEKLTTIREADLHKLHGMGPKGVDLLRSALNARGQSFAGQVEDTRMESEEPIFDSPQDWVKSHIREYLESDGQKGALWQGQPALLLVTRGRKSGKLRRTALFYGRHGANYLIVASNGGAPNHPAWYLNLVDNPEVELQVGSEKFAARAHTATEKERLRLGQVMKKIFPLYDEFQAKTGREIPLVIVEPG